MYCFAVKNGNLIYTQRRNFQGVAIKILPSLLYFVSVVIGDKGTISFSIPVPRLFLVSCIFNSTFL